MTTERRLWAVAELPPAQHDPTFVRAADAEPGTFEQAATVSCPICPAKRNKPCIGSVFAGYHTPRLRKAKAKSR